jgi:peptide/nickel transport system substrate-binding protein
VADQHDNAITRRRLLKVGTVGALGVAGADLLAACGSSSTAASSSVTTGKPVHGGTLTAAFLSGGQAETISPALAYAPADIARVQNLHDSLFRIGPNGYGGQPALAEKAERNADATVWTFHLRDGVTWHNGKPFNADDVVYTIKSWLGKRSFLQPLASVILNSSGVRKRDRLTVEVKLTRGVAEFPTLTALYNAYVIQDGASLTDPVGTGPFVYQSFTPGQRSVFTKNPHYWLAGEPYVDTLVIDSSYTDDNARVNAVVSGSADVVTSMPYTLAKVDGAGGSLRIGNAPSSSFQNIVCRVDQAPFTDVRVIQALKMLIDRPAIIQSAFDGYGSISNDCPQKGNPYFASDIAPWPHDVEQAKSLLKAAGQENQTLTLQTSQGVIDGMYGGATLFAEQAAQGGVKIKLQSIPGSTFFTPAGNYLNRKFTQDFWFLYPSLTSLYLDKLFSRAPVNETHFGNPAYDALLFDAVGDTNPATAADKWHAVQEQIHNLDGDIIYANMNYVDGYANRVKGLKTTSAGVADNFNFASAWLSS